MIKCLTCQKRKATKHPLYGYLSCNQCLKKQREFTKPNRPVELTTDEIKEARKIYEKDIVQPWNQGYLSKEYVHAQPERVAEMLKEGTATVEDVNNAKPVWDDNNYYKSE